MKRVTQKNAALAKEAAAAADAMGEQASQLASVVATLRFHPDPAHGARRALPASRLALAA